MCRRQYLCNFFEQSLFSPDIFILFRNPSKPLSNHVKIILIVGEASRYKQVIIISSHISYIYISWLSYISIDLDMAQSHIMELILMEFTITDTLCDSLA
jgi:hypothetical protein